MLNRKNVVFVSNALDSKREECDIEDLFNRDTFLRLVHESYDLKPATLKLPGSHTPASTTQAASAWSSYHPAFATAAE